MTEKSARMLRSTRNVVSVDDVSVQRTSGAAAAAAVPRAKAAPAGADGGVADALRSAHAEPDGAAVKNTRSPTATAGGPWNGEYGPSETTLVASRMTCTVPPNVPSDFHKRRPSP